MGRTSEKGNGETTLKQAIALIKTSASSTLRIGVGWPGLD